ncbi:MAG: hypothetical protein KIS94_00810 [Chitinophagales bacterium]|nr:hypothetical protein [Chitinophagales bacterium]
MKRPPKNTYRFTKQSATALAYTCSHTCEGLFDASDAHSNTYKSLSGAPDTRSNTYNSPSGIPYTCSQTYKCLFATPDARSKVCERLFNTPAAVSDALKPALYCPITHLTKNIPSPKTKQP